jgi:hypothetical protein
VNCDTVMKVAVRVVRHSMLGCGLTILIH